MLYLQRASAGSGKTYTLARNFIRLFISVRDNGVLRLRTPREMADELPKIIAITFTNKATNEMKERIVDKLSRLAQAADNPPSNKKEAQKTDYLQEFSESFNATYQEIGIAARSALEILLNKYSDFKVSTIDSFFQEILRNFTYEANINDNFQVELDNEYVASASIDLTLHDIDRETDGSSMIAKWLSLIMSERNDNMSQWNVFHSRNSKKSIYSEIKEAVKRMDNELFKDIKDALDHYFSQPDSGMKLYNAYLIMKEEAEKEKKSFFEKMTKHADKLRGMIEAYIEPGKDLINSHVEGHLKKIASYSFDTSVKVKNDFNPDKLLKKETIFKTKKSVPDMKQINTEAMEMYKSFLNWKDPLKNPKWTYWKVYGPLLPYLGIISGVRENIRNFLDSNSLIQIDDTKTILHKIIGDDDTPFIYERLGSYIDHYLIDEFQDTSKMQWHILRPLVEESESRDQENLIIGDAKQSIYRFRNAEPSLITSVIPGSFSHLMETGASIEENTNWRSKKNIVLFNNYVFSLLAEKATSMADPEKRFIDFENLYSNVIQYPHNQEEEGFINVRFLEKVSKKEEDEENDSKTSLKDISDLVADLIKRGYRQKDIAVIVSTNQEGKDVISAFMEHNSKAGEEVPAISFVSEESLTVSSSSAVKIIILLLEKLIEKKEKTKTAGLSLQSLRNPGLRPGEQAVAFLEGEDCTADLQEMTSDMQTLALPALVEALTEKFVPQSQKEEEAIYLAALQDMVLDYCETYSSDIPSFLEWWYQRGASRSVFTPETTNAVSVMTIHKSKGLEFKCVILPFVKNNLTPSYFKSEWRWVAPALVFNGVELPPVLPVATTSALLDTEHADVYRDYFDHVLMDNLNFLYVAFTRAVDELYIFARKDNKSANIGTMLADILEEISENTNPMNNLFLPGNKIKCNEEKNDYTIGTPFDPLKEQKDKEESRKENRNKEIEREQASRLLKEYYINGNRPILHFTLGEPDEMQSIGAAEENDAMREEGDMLHSVMSLIRYPEDLPNALRLLETRGMITTEKAEELKEFLSRKLANPLVSRWFDKEWRVKNERPINCGNQKERRPDRIIESRDGKQAVVIDYKFGESGEKDSYIWQVKRYIRLYKEASGREDVKGFVWYVREDLVTDVLSGKTFSLV